MTAALDGRLFSTLANKITIARILAIPVIVIALLQNHPIAPWLIGAAAISDFLDGLAARVRGERTAVGAFLDPMADKLLLTALYIMFVYRGWIPAWVFVVFFSRDLLIVLGWFVIYILTGSSSIEPRRLGRAATALQMTTALGFAAPGPMKAVHLLLWITVAATVVSAVDYIVTGDRRLGGMP